MTTERAELLALADAVDAARKSYLDKFGHRGESEAKDALMQILWDDKATFAPALRSLAAAPDGPSAGSNPLLTITYTNYKGETSVRHIDPKSLRFGSTEWHLEPQWLLLAYDTDKQAHREFALKDFGAQPAPGFAEGVEACRELKAIEDADRVYGALIAAGIDAATASKIAIRGGNAAIASLCTIAAPEGRKEVTGWQPINTAPLDKTMVALLLINGNERRYGVGWYMPLDGWRGWYQDGDYRSPTHWFPLPDVNTITPKVQS